MEAIIKLIRGSERFWMHIHRCHRSGEFSLLNVYTIRCNYHTYSIRPACFEFNCCPLVNTHYWNRFRRLSIAVKPRVFILQFASVTYVEIFFPKSYHVHVSEFVALRSRSSEARNSIDSQSASCLAFCDLKF